MAEIYLARQGGLAGFERIVVIKKILPHLSEEPEFVSMFLEEARLAALINHPNVVQIFDVGVDRGEYFIAMEHIAGVTLAAMIRAAAKQGRPVSIAAALEIVAQTCDGLACAHALTDVSGAELGVVHRDVTPQNLMATRAGILKIVDFGIAKATIGPGKTQFGHLKGKYPYMSPEQARSEPLDGRSDLFSLGTVLYEMLTNKNPFDAPSELEVLQNITLLEPPPPSASNPEVPPMVDALVMRALAKKRDHRFATAREMGKKSRVVLEEMGRSSTTEILRAELAGRFDDLFTAQRQAVEDAVSHARTAPWKGTPTGPGPDASEAETRLEPSGAAVAARRAERRRLARWAGITALFLAIAGGAAFVAIQQRTDSRANASPPAASVALTPEYPGPPLRYGVIPFVTEEVVRREMDPLVRYLSRKLERRITLVVGRAYDEITEGVATGRLDAAQLSPLQYVRARDRDPRVRLLAVQTYEGSRSYEGYLVARDDSLVEQPADLAGKRMCYVESGSASGWLLPRAFLRRSNLNPDTLFADQRMSGDHVAVMRDVLEGRCDAGAVYSGALLAGRDLGLPAGRLRVVAVTGRLPYDATVASANLGDADAARLRQALIALDVRREFGVTVLGKTLRIGGYVAGDDALFDPVRQAVESEEMAERPSTGADGGPR